MIRLVFGWWMIVYVGGVRDWYFCLMVLGDVWVRIVSVFWCVVVFVLGIVEVEFLIM